MPEQSTRIIVTLAPGVEVADRTAFERMVLERTSVKLVYAAAVADRVHAFTLLCEPVDAGCAHAKEVLMDSDLFTSIADDKRRGSYR